MVRAFLDATPSINVTALMDLGGRLIALNDLRRAAAHTEVIHRDTWLKGHRLVLGTGDSVEPGLLAGLVSALRLGDATS